jgi:hypothetical protein
MELSANPQLLELIADTAEAARLLADELWEARQPTRRALPSGAGEVASGTITAKLEPVPVGFCWLVDRIVYTTTSSGNPQPALYLGDQVDGYLIDFPAVGAKVVSAPPEPIYIEGGVQLRAVWTSASAGSTGFVRLQVRVEPLYLTRRTPSRLQAVAELGR